MSQIPFSHLHSHTEYSLLDGSNRIKDYLDRVKELGMTSAAITDHGVMYGVIDFYQYAKSIGIHPIIGCEVYVSPGDMEEKNGQTKRYYHLVLLAENNTGYNNLIKIVSLGFTKGFYYRPRIDFKTLEQYHEGLIALSACLAGEVPKKLQQGSYKMACETALRYQTLFGAEHYYLELQDHGIPEQKSVNKQLVQMSRELGIPLVATNDVHYTKKEDAEVHDVLLCIQTKKKVYDPDRLRYEGGQYYVKSAEEMEQLFPEYPEALENTEKIAGRCHVDIDFGVTKLPRFDVPPGYDSWSYLNHLCAEGLQARYPKDDGTLAERLYYELGVIQNMGYVDYFLIVWDFINWARTNNIPVGPGRGSAAGSIVSYCLGITQVDPIKYGLLFERFLNPQRVTMPDIDVDFCYERRQEVIEYVIGKYGKDNVAQIVTFGTLAAKGVIRDVGKALDIAPSTISKITQLIPNDTKTTISGALSSVAELKKYYENDETVRGLLDIASRLEGLPRHTSTHAAGVVICPKPVTEFVPVCLSTEGGISTQYIMTTLEELGLLKMDFLGLRTLTVIQKAIQEAGAESGQPIVIDYEDADVYQYIGTGQTEGIFQLESDGMRQFMKQLKPANLEDLIAGISLYRPGPMDFIPKYLKGKSDPASITYEIPQLEEILSPTYGCIIYQEQVMQIVRALAGYSFGRADLVRRAMSKKKTTVMEQERQIFLYGDGEIPGCEKNGIPVEAANRVFDQMIDFAKYAFNKSHAATYAVVALQTAYLKYHYPAHYLASLMTSVRSVNAKTAEYLLLSRQLQIPIAKPDVRDGNVDFTVRNREVLYSLSSIRDVGDGIVEEIVRQRSRKPFSSLQDFITRMYSSGLGKPAIEALIKSGALDCMGHTRKYMMAHYPDMLSQIQYDKKNGTLGQIPLLSLFADKGKPEAEEEYMKAELLAYEKEVLGIYLSGHPLDEYYSEWIATISARTCDFLFAEDGCKVKDGERVTIGGIITAMALKTTKNKKTMAFLTLEDIVGSVEVIVFPSQYEKTGTCITEGEKYFLHGSVKQEDMQDAKLILEKIERFQAQTDLTEASEVWLQFFNYMAYREKIAEIETTLQQFPGKAETFLYLKTEKQVKKLTYFRCSASIACRKQLTAICGSQNIFIK